MLVIIDENTNPYFNLATEEFLFKEESFNQTIVRIWQNKPAIIVGKFQNTLNEINYDFVHENDIAIVRRITGGGAVYHDLGNINYTIIEQKQSSNIDFISFAQPIVKILEKYNIKAICSGRNDIHIENLKISGGAQTISNNRILHHGTLLFASDFNNMSKALNVSTNKLSAKGISSVKSRVGNISDFMTKKISTKYFFTDIQNYFLDQKDSNLYNFTPDQLLQIQDLVQKKYSLWEWNYGKSPDYNINRTIKYFWGELSILLLVQNDHIKDINVYGDFFSNHDLQNIFKIFIGKRYEKATIKEIILQSNIADYLPELTNKQLLEHLI